MKWSISEERILTKVNSISNWQQFHFQGKRVPSLGMDDVSFKKATWFLPGLSDLRPYLYQNFRFQFMKINCLRIQESEKPWKKYECAHFVPKIHFKCKYRSGGYLQKPSNIYIWSSGRKRKSCWFKRADFCFLLGAGYYIF